MKRRPPDTAGKGVMEIAVDVDDEHHISVDGARLDGVSRLIGDRLLKMDLRAIGVPIRLNVTNTGYRRSTAPRDVITVNTANEGDAHDKSKLSEEPKVIRAALIALVALIGCSTSAAHDAASGSAAPTPAVDSRPPGATDDMIAIPSGYYPWDTHTCDTSADYERTAHAYHIDRTTVLCADYRACVKAKHCPSYGGETCKHENATVPRDAAAKYCAWRGAELPSVGQWQKAARKDGRFCPNGYLPDVENTCKTHDPGAQFSSRDRAIAMMRCIYTSPYGMDVPLILLTAIGEWTRDDSCPTEADETPRPLAVKLAYRLDELTTPPYPYQEFRCVRSD